MFTNEKLFWLKGHLCLLGVLLLLGSGCSVNGVVKKNASNGDEITITEANDELPSGKTIYRVAAMDKLMITANPLLDEDVEYRFDYYDRIGLEFTFTGDSYEITAGDKLHISIDADDESGFDAVVRPDGYISIPNFTDEVKASGMTPVVLTSKVRKVYRKVMRTPKVTVSLVESAMDRLDALNDSFLIDQDGRLVLPLLGAFKARGSSAEELADEIAAVASDYFNNRVQVTASVVDISEQNHLNEEIVVSPDGSIFLRDLGKLEARGKDLATLSQEIQDALQLKYMNPLEVHVSLLESNSMVVMVGGEVKRPGSYPYVESMSLIQILGNAGWLSDRGDLTEVKLIHRAAEGEYFIYTTDLTEVLEGDADINDLKLSPMDVVLVPRTNVAEVNLWVEQYIIRMLPIGINVNHNYNYINAE